jgi:hypothetical protein
VSGVVLLHLAATWFMTGLIWFVHVVHYRLFSSVDAASFASYEAKHTRLTGWVVGPPMLIELATAAYLVFLTEDPFCPSPICELGLGLLLLIWALTGLVAVPAHTRLARGFDPKAHRLLMRGNAARVLLWSLRALLAAYPMWARG